MNTWILDAAIARLLSTNAVVLTEQPNSQMVGNPYLGITSGFPVIRPELGRTIQSRIKINFPQRDFWGVSEILLVR